jgi:predicted XRE-type DNA-binding protein
MPSPESSRRNLEHARTNGQVKFWRTRGESQHIKAEIVLLYHTNAGLSQRVIARTFHVSQPYVQRLLARVRTRGIEKALGAEAYEHYRAGMEVKRRKHFQAVGGPASLTAEPSYPELTRAFNWAFEEPQPSVPTRYEAPAAAMEKSDEPAGVKYVELGRSTTGEIIEMHGSKPVRTVPLYAPRPPRTLTTKEIAQMMDTGGLSVADQCPSFGRR